MPNNEEVSSSLLSAESELPKTCNSVELMELTSERNPASDVTKDTIKGLALGSSTDLKIFTMFPRLCFNLRCMIWQEICNIQRTIVLNHNETRSASMLASTSTLIDDRLSVPVCLAINRESRGEALKCYELIREIKLQDNDVLSRLLRSVSEEEITFTGKAIFVNWKVDRFLHCGITRAMRNMRDVHLNPTVVLSVHREVTCRHDGDYNFRLSDLRGIRHLHLPHWEASSAQDRRPAVLWDELSLFKETVAANVTVVMDARSDAAGENCGSQAWRTEQEKEVLSQLEEAKQTSFGCYLDGLKLGFIWREREEQGRTE